MCGIAGIFGREERELVRRMISRMKHRGPDDEGYYFDTDISLGMCRLSIIDVEGGQQPIYNEEGSICVVLNGEIYNFKELKIELETKGHKFYTRSDTEVLVHLYEEYGHNLFEKLDGMFAFAIWDSNKKELFLARDRLGIKPLYYTIVNNEFIFASEIKAIIEYEAINREVDKTALANYFSLRYVPAPKTMFEGIMKLKPAHYLAVNKDGIREERYWDLKCAPMNRSQEYFEEKIIKGLQESVKERLIADVPLGAFLSGGVDSSFIVALMSQLIDEPVKTFSVGFIGEEFDERSYASYVADYFGTDHHEIEVRIDRLDILPKIVKHFDEPIADPAAIPTYLISEFARKNVKVVLTGEGGDEMFGGYERYQSELKFNRYLSLIPDPFRKSLKLFNIIPGKYATFLSSRVNEVESYSLRLEGYDNPPVLNIKTENNEGVKNMVEKSFQDKPDYLCKMIYFDTKYWLPDELLMKVDKMSMANSLEARVPFLDHRFVEFAFNIPSDYKIRDGVEKFILKGAAKKILPDKVIERKKHGFNVPIKIWFRESRDIIDHYMDKELLKQVEHLNAEKVTRVWNKHRRNRGDYEFFLWKVLNYAIWWEEYMVVDK